MRLAAFLILCALAALSQYGCAANPAIDPVSRSGLYFDTAVSVSLYDYKGSSDKILDGCMEKCAYYESIFSATVEGSDVWNINHAFSDSQTSGGNESDDQIEIPETDLSKDTSDNKPIDMSEADGMMRVPIHEETAELINTALSYCESSDGALDLTVGALADLWDIQGNLKKDVPTIPDEAAIQNALAKTDYRTISVETAGGQSYALLSDDVNVTLGFIAKGYVADRLCEYLKESGVTSALIDLGGNIKALGSKPDGSDFCIGIQKPFEDRGEAITKVYIHDSSVVSSGTYERYFESGGQVYHHILDTKTGRPTDNGIIAVSIMAPDSVDADALSTLCLIKGLEDGLKLIESTPDAEALFITEDYELISSSGWEIRQ